MEDLQMNYDEREILVKREEEKRKKFNSIRQGYYVGNKILQFEKENIYTVINVCI